MNPDQIKRIFPNASQSTIRANGGAPNPELERGPRARSLAKAEAKNRHPGIHVVSVTSYRTRLCDEDNLCEKYHVDGLRYAGIIPSDAPDQTHIIVSQKKVATKAEEKTLIEVTYPREEKTK